MAVSFVLQCTIVRAGIFRRPLALAPSPVLRSGRAALRLALLYRVAGSGGRILTNGGLTDDPAHGGAAAAATPQARAQARAAPRADTPHARASVHWLDCSACQAWGCLRCEAGSVAPVPGS
jgi:hypothetical protein